MLCINIICSLLIALLKFFLQRQDSRKIMLDINQISNTRDADDDGDDGDGGAEDNDCNDEVARRSLGRP